MGRSIGPRSAPGRFGRSDKSMLAPTDARELSVARAKGSGEGALNLPAMLAKARCIY
jgi:hypothetical protein